MEQDRTEIPSARILKKEQKKDIKVLQLLFDKLYAATVEMRLAGHLSGQDVLLLNQYYFGPKQMLEHIMKREQEKLHEYLYSAALNENPIEKIIAIAESRWKAWKQERERVVAIKAVTEEELMFKTSKLAQIDNMIRDSEQMLDEVYDIRDAHKKKKPGRKPKTAAQEIVNALAELDSQAKESEVVPIEEAK